MAFFALFFENNKCFKACLFAFSVEYLKSWLQFSVTDYARYLGVPLRVGLFAIMSCLSGQAISAAIPNAKSKI
jgi:hypothetical protein